MSESQVIPAGHGGAFGLDRGDCLRITLHEGPQVVDTWAFSRSDPDEFLSCEHTRSCLERLCPRVGEAFFSNRRRAVLTLVEDTSPGVHDLLLSACDQQRYSLLGHSGPHRTCADNFMKALDKVGWKPIRLPSPVNLFENVSMVDGRLEIRPPSARRGDYVSLRAEIDLVVVLSACPMDIVATNGANGLVKPVTVTRLPAA